MYPSVTLPISRPFDKKYLHVAMQVHFAQSWCSGDDVKRGNLTISYINTLTRKMSKYAEYIVKRIIAVFCKFFSQCIDILSYHADQNARKKF